MRQEPSGDARLVCRWADAAAHLASGRTVSFRPRGQSMAPRVRSGQLVTVTPVLDPAELRVDDIVLCRVQGVMRLHKISAIRRRLMDGVPDDHLSNSPSARYKFRFQISNSKGHVNGWCGQGDIYGRLVQVED
jgi:hypothetical protein